MFFIIYGRDKPDSGEVRRQNKEAHKAHLTAGAPGVEVLQSGPLTGPDGTECGSLVVLRADNAEAVQGFLAKDPYSRAGLYAEFQVHPWMWRRGNPYLDDADK